MLFGISRLISMPSNKYFFHLLPTLQSYIQTPLTLSENKTISIVIPAYNEEKRIRPVLDELCNYIKSNELPWNVIISIDGDDKTEQIVNSFHEVFPFVVPNTSKSRNGMGGAIKRGILASNDDYIILMDADGSSRISDLIPSLDFVEWFDIVNFNRYEKGENNIPLKRKFASRGLNFILKAIFKINVKDTQCGYKILKKSSIIPIINSITYTNAFFLSALFLYAKKNGLKTLEIPIEYHHTDGSKFNVIMTAVSYLISIAAFKTRNSKLYSLIPGSIKRLYYTKFRYL